MSRKGAPDDTERLTVRLPKPLKQEIERFAAGGRNRPRSSMNDTFIYLLRKGLEAEGLTGCGQQD